MSACGGSGDQSAQDPSDATAGDEQAAESTDTPTDTPTDEPVTLKMWIWFPSADIYQPAIEAYEKDHPNVTIDLTVMESQAYQQKLPIALATDEQIDLCGVQLGAMVGQIESYLAPIDGLLDEVAPEWKNTYNPADLETDLNQTSDGSLKFLTMVKVGSMVGFYNADIFAELGLEPPKTIEDYKTVVETIQEKKPDVMPVAFAGKDAWVQDEMMLTVQAQNNDYYNKWRYDDAPYDSPEFVQAFTDYKKFFDEGIFTKDVMDLDYASATDKFISGQAATYFMGTWDAGLLSQSYRDNLGATIGNVGAFALPTVEPGGEPAIRSFAETGVGIVNTSAHQKEAAEFLNYIVMGEGMQIMGQNFIGIPSKSDFVLDESLLTTPEAKDGYAIITDLSLNAKVDRNNVSDFSEVVGAAVQNVVTGQLDPADAVKQLGEEWSSGKYGG
jgi:raffinose/stachyose/melibiose transport system substrate-binding protein